MYAEQPKTVQVTLSLAPPLYKLVEFFAATAGNPVETWIADKADGELPMIADQYTGFACLTDERIERPSEVSGF
jgi:hypothetical protein